MYVARRWTGKLKTKGEKMHKITIQKTPEGAFDVKIGCQRFFFATPAGLGAELGFYVVNHDAVDAAYNKYQNRISECEAIRSTLNMAEEVPDTLRRTDRIQEAPVTQPVCEIDPL